MQRRGWDMSLELHTDLGRLVGLAADSGIIAVLHGDGNGLSVYNQHFRAGVAEKDEQLTSLRQKEVIVSAFIAAGHIFAQQTDGSEAVLDWRTRYRQKLSY